MKFLKGILKSREISVFLFLILLSLVVGLINHSYLAPNNIMESLKGSIIYILLSIGMTFVLLIKEIDVSVGAILGIVAAISGTMLRNNDNIFLVIIFSLIIGALCGLVNGIGVTKLKIPSIVMTLGMMGILRGLMFVYTDGKWVENIPVYFKKLSQLRLLHINVFVILTFMLAIIAQLYLSRSKRGKYFAAIGDNLEGAILIGIKVDWRKLMAFVLSGICSALGALVYVSQIGFVGNVAGNGMEMIAIAACVLGGVSLNGGVGSVVGATFGAIIMNSINNLLVFLKIPAYWNNVISGFLLLIIVVPDVVIHNYIAEKARKERLSVKSM